MKKLHYILLLLLSGIIFGTAYAVVNVQPHETDVQFTNSEQAVAAEDTAKTKFPVRDGKLDTYDDLDKSYPMDLKDPTNYSTQVKFDPETNLYYFHTKVGDMDVTTPYSMTSSQYKDYSLQQSMRNYWQEKMSTEIAKEKDKKFSLTDMQLDLGGADKVFGPGGVQIKMQGSTELLFGFKINRIQNPTLSERMRKPSPIFDFDEKIQMNVNAKVGEKVSFGMNYNTESSFDFDQSKIKLAFEGKEDDIVKRIEAGNVSLTLNSALIRGSTALFGIKTDLQFGKLNISAIATQQESESKTVSLRNGAQTTRFEIEADEYDENRHFFLAHYFRDNYEKNMSRLPYINSGMVINRVEVWVTNKRADFTQARNIIAFMDLGETNKLDNTHWAVLGGPHPYNKANNLYDDVKSIEGVRDVQQVNSKLNDHFDPSLEIEGGEDFEKVESARRLEPSEYTLNTQLGYISLRSQLNTDEVLAVSFEYTLNGKVYQVGEFSTDGIEAPDALILKLIKGTSFTYGPKNWDLMMKNIYSLGAAQIQSENFKLDVTYQSDSTGVYINYIPEGIINNKPLIKVLSLDRLDKSNQLRPDGLFDYVPGYTIDEQTGRIIFPVLEPFGSALVTALNDPDLALKIAYTELYERTKTEAIEFAEKNKFKIKGEYKSSVGSEIRLNAMNVPQGSVKVTAGGVLLTENVDYTVDYSMGTVTILNQSILESGTSIDVSLESQSFFSMQRKSLSGVHLEYMFNKDFSMGATMMHFSEKPLTTKVSMGDEPMSNTIWGLNTSFKKESQLLTNLLDKLPFLKATAPSSFTFTGEFAQLNPGHSKVVGKQGLSYLDDFEASKTGINIQYPYSWFLASTPPRDGFLDASYSNNVDYGKNRALISWYNIDPIFTRNTTTTPDHLRQDVEQLSNHFVREVLEQEIFPNRDPIVGQANSLSVLNISYYPKERGPYNLDATDINPDGTLMNPDKRWGGIMRRMEVPDFQAANIEYIEFWMLDPFVYNKTASGGDLIFNLGEISEDILKDGKKSFENGLPIKDDTTQTVSTVWGRIPKSQSMVNAFDNSESSRDYQDVGLDGLSNAKEFTFDSYRTFVNNYQAKIAPANLAALQADPFSALNDPAGDNYHYFRGSDFDDAKVGILGRYKRYNGMDGNSPVTTSTSESYTTSATTLPNVEDINQDNNLSEYEQFYIYKVSLRPADMMVGKNHITDKVVTTVRLKNGNNEEVTWYQFKIPVREWDDESEGTRRLDFKSIRFMRIYLTGFEEETHLRFATMELVRGDWRKYNKDLYPPKTPPITTSTAIDVSVINVEENSDRKPVNYVLPTGITREQDPSQAQIRQENEQSLSLKVTDLSPYDSRAIYKNTSYDMRQFKRMQLFVHAEKLIDDVTDLKNSELTAFIRIGSDLSENYYQYEIPLKLTPPGTYAQDEESGDRRIVWPDVNMFDFPLSLLTDVKLNRNVERKRGKSSLIVPYTEYDPEKPNNKVTIVGNPNLGDIQNIMIGVRNQSNQPKSGEIWINELRMSDFNEDKGYAALGNATLNLSDFGSINMAGRVETTGFGSVEDNILDRRMDNFSQFNVSTNFELGRLFPEQAKIKLPLFYSYSKELVKPKYDSFNQDVLLSETIDNASSESEKDSINDYCNSVFTTRGFNLTNVKVDIKSKTPMFYDPTNFSFGYAYTESNQHNSEMERNLIKDYKGSFDYTYSITPKAVEPFKKVKFLNKPAFKIISDINFFYLPSSVSYNTTLMRQYNEIQLRNLNNLDISYTDPQNALLSSSKDFLWNRRFDIKYDLSRALKFTFNTATNAHIDETKFTPVNKELFPTEYENWKDTVMRSLGSFGRPLAYQQVITASYAIPINKIPMFSWISSNILYNGDYTWDRGPLTAEDEAANSAVSSMGNRITSLGAWQFDGRFGLEQLYEKSPYLKRVNQRFSPRNLGNRDNKKEKPPRRRNEQKLILLKDKKSKVIHRLNAPMIKVTAYDTAKNEIKIKYDIIDKNTIEILAPKQDIGNVLLIVEALDPNDVKGLPNILQYAARTIMMVRNVSFNYNQSNGIGLTGYQPENGIIGQDKAGSRYAPGLLFALGYQEPDFLQNAYDNNWLIHSTDAGIEAASKTYTSDFSVKMAVEPIPGFKIDLGALRNYSSQSLVQYVYPGMPTNITGSFSMSTIAIATIFKKSGDVTDNYYSEVYETFKAYRSQAAQIMNNKYRQDVLYPNGGFMSEKPALIGTAYDESIGQFTKNSADVLIPSFIAAYTGTDLKNQSFQLIPTFLKLLPNWRISYDGLSRIPFIKSHFKSVNLTHAYTCKYNIGSFASYANWVESVNGYGFVKDVASENPIPSSQYDVASVSITENFNPLVRVEVTMKNSLSLSTEYRTGRNLALNIASTQVVESNNKEFVLGIGYRIPDFDVILQLKNDKEQKIKNDLNLRMDISRKDFKTLIRKIDDDLATQATVGDKTFGLQFSAEYVFSSKMNLRLFYDIQTSSPLVSSSYPTSSQNFGVSVKLLLTR